MISQKIIIAFSAMLLVLVLLSCDLPFDGNSENNDSDGYQIIFDANEGTGSITAIPFNSGETKKLTQNEGQITREGYVFICWNTAPDGSGTEYVQQEYVTPEDEDLTLYAQWYVYYNLGDIGPAGGRIFYRRLDESSPVFHYPPWMYLEAASKDFESDEKAWGGSDQSYWLTENSSDGVGAGLENTQLIMSRFNGDYAAHYCGNLVSGTSHEFDDWYLPNRLELAYMCENLYKSGLGDFESTSGTGPYIFYWSSHQGSNPNQGKAYVICFDTEMSGFTQVNMHLLSSTYHVRPIRRF